MSSYASGNGIGYKEKIRVLPLEISVLDNQVCVGRAAKQQTNEIWKFRAKRIEALLPRKRNEEA